MKIAALYLSPGHNFVGRHGLAPGGHPTVPVDAVECLAGRGLRGDRFLDHQPDYRGQITFFAEEVHRELGRVHAGPAYSPDTYRRNVLTRGADLNALIGREFTVQGVTFRGVEECRPCYWMDTAVAPGTEARLRGRGGLRARVLSDGWLRVDCPLAAAVLFAGGRARRLGRDKAMLPWGKATLGDHQARTLAGTGCWPLWLACRADQPWCPPGFVRREDPAGEEGAVEALVRSLAASPSPVLVALAVDVPGVPADLLAAWAGRAREEEKSVVPFSGGGFEVLAAAWHRSALPELRETLVRGASLQQVCRRLQAQGRLVAVEMDPAAAHRTFANLNTPADLGAWRRESEGEEGGAERR